MLLNTYIQNEDQLKACRDLASCKEVLIESAALSRIGKLASKKTNNLGKLAKEYNISPVLVWDVIMTEQDFHSALNALEEIDLSLFSSIRVYDIGAAEWIKENHPDKKIQLICESGNHNKQALLAWETYFGKALERLVLSIELPENVLLDYCKTLKTPLEILAAGRLEIFYSPRKLLSNHFENQAENLRYIEVLSASEENHERDFPTIETAHGTFMYLDKDYFILDKLERLSEAGLHTARIDLRHLEEKASFSKLLNLPANQLKKAWPNKTAATFFKRNKTDKQLKKRSRDNSLREDKHTLAEIIASEQGEFVLYRAIRDFKLSGPVKLITPEKKERLFEMLNLKDLNHKAQREFKTSELFFSSWLPNAVVGSIVQKESTDGN